MPTTAARRRFRYTVALTIAGLVALSAAVAFSPLILRRALGPSSTWSDVATVAQAYGGVAALISAVALVAVAVSLLLQWRQARLLEIFMIRERHVDLVRLGIERPDLLTITTGEAHRSEANKRVYANLWFMHWTTRWDLGQMDEHDLRHASALMFEDPTVRDWWALSSPHWTSYMAGYRARHNRQFVEILNDECQRAAKNAAQQRGSEAEPDLSARVG